MPEQIAGRWVQVTVPAESAELLRDACIVSLQSGAFDKHEHAVGMLNDLKDFFAFAAENPRAFPPSGTMAVSLKTRQRRARNPIPLRNDGTPQDGEPTKRAHRKTNRPTRHAKRLAATKERKANREASITDSDVAGDGLQPRTLRERLFSRGGAPSPEVQAAPERSGLLKGVRSYRRKDLS